MFHSIEFTLRVRAGMAIPGQRRLEKIVLQTGTRLRAVAWYDNSKNNPHNPDPEKTVTWGDQTSDEMMVGFFDVAVPVGVGKPQFFVRKNSPN